MKIGIFGDRTPPLGQLERDVLDEIWRNDARTAQDIFNRLLVRRQATLSAIQTTLERLTRKKLLSREKRGRSYIYEPTVSRGELLARMVSDLMDALAGDNRNAPVSALLENEDNVSNEVLDRLEQFLKDRRNGKET